MDTLRHLLLLSTVLSVVLWTNCSSVIKIQKCNCIVHNHQLIRNTSCLAKPVNRTITVLNVQFWVTKELNDIFINGDLYRKTVVSYRPFLVNVTENFCEFMKKNRAGPYLRMVGNIYRPYSNINHPCPYSGLISVKEMPVNMNKVAMIFPEGDYRVDMHIYEGRTNRFLTIQSFFELK